MSRRRTYRNRLATDANTLLLLHFDDIVKDEVENYVFTYSSAPAYVAGKFGDGIQFNSSTQKLISDKALDIKSLNEWTIDLWIKGITISSTYDSLALDTRSNYKGYTFGLGNGYAYFSITDGNTGVNCLANVNTSTLLNWNHYAIIKIGTTVKLYINGILSATQTYQASIFGYGDKLYIGNYFNNYANYSIAIDELRVSNIARWTSNFNPQTKAY